MNSLFDYTIFSLLPFFLMLGAIAIFPLKAEHFWEKNNNKLYVVLMLSLPIVFFMLINNNGHQLFEIMLYDYVPFLILLSSLFIITGGIHIDSTLDPNPQVNIGVLVIGALLASIVGTTGAAMLLIRPLLHINKNRKNKVHTILFFIAIVANCGGLLTPLGDPPLFMMYLRGVDFLWFSKLFKEWFVANSLLILVYYFIDKRYWAKEEKIVEEKEVTRKHYVRVDGKLNFVWLLIVILAIAFINVNTIEAIKSNRNIAFFREGLLIIVSILSMIFTTKKVRYHNRFTWAPIQEVAYLFLGIFITMAPVLQYLETHADKFSIKFPYQFYYITGALSSFLDNTPTAVTFYTLCKGLVDKNAIGISGNLVAGIPELFMQAICVGAVFFGAMTYIGNGPNFMVKSIAESNGIKMPHFFEYMYKFSLVVLLPIYVLIHLIFI